MKFQFIDAAKEEFPVIRRLCCINLKRASEPSRMGHSGRKAEELVHKADFACHVTLCQAAMAAADHPRDGSGTLGSGISGVSA